jgi:hypothetical protein
MVRGGVVAVALGVAACGGPIAVPMAPMVHYDDVPQPMVDVAPTPDAGPMVDATAMPDVRGPMPAPMPDGS